MEGKSRGKEVVTTTENEITLSCTMCLLIVYIHAWLMRTTESIDCVYSMLPIGVGDCLLLFLIIMCDGDSEAADLIGLRDSLPYHSK